MTGSKVEFSLRPVSGDDDEFLFRLYASTRAVEVASWGWSTEQQDAFLRMQYRAQKGSYDLMYPESLHEIIEIDGNPVGKLILGLQDDDRVLFDIAVLSEYRGRGIGTAVITDLLRIAERERRAVRLQVLKGNPAMRLYERLGFVHQAESVSHIHMKWLPSCAKTLNHKATSPDAKGKTQECMND